MLLKRKALPLSTSVFAVTSGDGMKAQGDMEVDSSANGAGAAVDLSGVHQYTRLVTRVGGA